MADAHLFFSFLFFFCRYSGVVDCIKKIYAAGGVKSLFRGISFTLIRAAPVAATILPVYEHVKDSIEEWSAK